MTYNDAIQYLYSATPVFHLSGGGAYKPGLNTIRSLLSDLGHPHRQWHSVHIAGTNGKGSCSHLIAAVLQAAGYKTGLFTSPHLVDFRERIRVNGQMITEEQVALFVEKNRCLIERYSPSFFEITTAMAFQYFADRKVDVAVVETGLGGRLDSTNVLQPDLSVITNIGYDHTEYLGDTLAKIAAEKAGIIKPATPVVIGETDEQTAPVFLQKAKEMSSPIVFADGRQYNVPDCELKGIYQQKNIQTVLCAIEQLQKAGYNISADAVRIGFAQVCELTGLQGRWQVYARQPLVILDTGHNSHGLRYVAKQLKQLLRDNTQSLMYIVFGMVADKDVEQVLPLLPHDGRVEYVFTEPATHRALRADLLQAMAEKCGLQGMVVPIAAQAIKEAYTAAREQDIVFIGGSNYLVGEALRVLPEVVSD